MTWSTFRPESDLKESIRLKMPSSNGFSPRNTRFNKSKLRSSYLSVLSTNSANQMVLAAWSSQIMQFTKEPSRMENLQDMVVVLSLMAPSLLAFIWRVSGMAEESWSIRKVWNWKVTGSTTPSMEISKNLCRMPMHETTFPKIRPPSRIILKFYLSLSINL